MDKNIRNVWIKTRLWRWRHWLYTHQNIHYGMQSKILLWYVNVTLKCLRSIVWNRKDFYRVQIKREKTGLKNRQKTFACFASILWCYAMKKVSSIACYCIEYSIYTYIGHCAIIFLQIRVFNAYMLNVCVYMNFSVVFLSLMAFTLVNG